MIDRENAMLLRFKELYGSSEGVGLARAPGRVNIIGEHTDYNEGYVLPMAIAWNTMVAFRPNGSRRVNVCSMAMEGTASFSLDDFRPAADAKWCSYVAGVAHALGDEGVELVGVDMVIHSTVPIGGGLSSSAALEVSSALAFLSAAGAEVERKRLALICQAAENRYVGMRCGIMDQYVALFGERGSAVKIDCRSLEHELVGLGCDDVRFVVCDTGVRHELAASEYNRRRLECEDGAAVAARVLKGEGVRSLRDLAPADLSALRDELDGVVFRRVRHVVTENARVVEAARSMREGNFVSLGVLMDVSHESLRDDFEVSCKELDAMVEIAWSQAGVYGSRMTGGGFGGCTITLVSAERADEFCRNAGLEYRARTGISPSIYICAPEKGAEVIRNARWPG